MLATKAYKINTPEVIHEILSGEVVVVNLEKGHYYSLVSLATTVWQCLSAGYSIDQITQCIAEHYKSSQDAIQDSIITFLNDLEREGIISAVAQQEEEASPADIALQFPPTFAVPVFETFTEMEDLLLLDPIHEVDAMGWPHQ